MERAFKLYPLRKVGFVSLLQGIGTQLPALGWPRVGINTEILCRTGKTEQPGGRSWESVHYSARPPSTCSIAKGRENFTILIALKKRQLASKTASPLPIPNTSFYDMQFSLQLLQNRVSETSSQCAFIQACSNLHMLPYKRATEEF